MKTTFAPDTAVDVQVFDNYTGEIIFTNDYTLGDIVSIIPWKYYDTKQIEEQIVRQFNDDLREFVQDESPTDVRFARACMKLLANGVYSCKYNFEVGWIQISLIV